MPESATAEDILLQTVADLEDQRCNEGADDLFGLLHAADFYCGHLRYELPVYAGAAAALGLSRLADPDGGRIGPDLRLVQAQGLVVITCRLSVPQNQAVVTENAPRPI